MGCTFKTLRVVYGDFTLGVHGEGFDYIFLMHRVVWNPFVKMDMSGFIAVRNRLSGEQPRIMIEAVSSILRAEAGFAADMFIECKDVEVITDGKSQGKAPVPRKTTSMAVMYLPRM